MEPLAFYFSKRSFFTLLIMAGVFALLVSRSIVGGQELDSSATSSPVTSTELYKSFTVAGKILHAAGVSPETNHWIGFTPTDGETLWFELTNKDGGFKVEGVPEGKYIVELWNEDNSLILPDPFEIEISQKTAPDNVFVLKALGIKKAVDKMRGRVFNLRDKKGLADITIATQTQVGRDVYFETKTDKAGNYELTVFPGQWVVWPDLGERKDIIQVGDAAYVTVESGIPAAGVDFPMLIADATLSGIVTLDGVNPIPNLSAYLEFYPPEGSELPVLGVEVEDGKFSLSVPAATYGIWIYLPSGSDYAVTTIQPFQEAMVKSGATEKIAITLKERDVVIEGAVKDVKGTILTGVPVTVYAEASGITEETEVDPKTGRYQLRVYSGVYRTWVVSYAVGEATRKFLSDQSQNFALPVSANARVTQDIVLYEADSSVEGKVFDANGKPLADVLVEYRNTDAEGNLFDPSGPYFAGSTVTEKDGSYQLALPSGKYTLSVSQEGFMSPQEQTVTISPQNPGKVDFKFAPIEATISGQVRLEGKGVVGYVSAWSENGAAVQANTDEDGHFVLHVSRDVWHLGATASIGNKYYVSDEVVVDVTKGGTKKLTIDLRLETEYVLPPPLTKTFDADRLAVLTLDDGTKITVPASAIQKSGTLTLIAVPTVFLPVEENARPLGLGYDLQARDAAGKNIVKFISDVYIAIPYTLDQLQLYGLTEDDLIPSYWDEKAGTWRRVKNVSIDREHKFIVIATNHFTKFALVTAKPITTVANIPPIAVKQIPKERLAVAVEKFAQPAQPPSQKAQLTTRNLIVAGSIVIIIVLLGIVGIILKRRKQSLPPPV